MRHGSSSGATLVSAFADARRRRTTLARRVSPARHVSNHLANAIASIAPSPPSTSGRPWSLPRASLVVVVVVVGGGGAVGHVSRDGGVPPKNSSSVSFSRSSRIVASSSSRLRRPNRHPPVVVLVVVVVVLGEARSRRGANRLAERGSEDFLVRLRRGRRERGERRVRDATCAPSNAPLTRASSSPPVHPAAFALAANAKPVSASPAAPAAKPDEAATAASRCARRARTSFRSSPPPRCRPL